MKRVVFEDGRGYVLVADAEIAHMHPGDDIWLDSFVFGPVTVIIEKIEEV